MESLNPNETERYSRHLLLPQVGVAGQLKLKATSVLIVGVGGLGSPAALYLAAAGIGRIGLVDFDQVDTSNLHRQILYGDSDVGLPKAAQAKARIYAQNPHVDVQTYEGKIGEIPHAIEGYDIVLDGTDTFEARYTINDACLRFGKPVVYASISQFEGQVSLFGVPGGPCYRCLFPSPPPPDLVPSCAEGGVLGVLPGLLGTIQATEAIKWVLGLGEPLVGRLLLVDALSMRFRELQVPRDSQCPVCGDGSPAHRGRVQSVPTAPEAVPEIDVHELEESLATPRPPHLLDVRRPDEHERSNLGGRLIPLHELAGRLDELESVSREPEPLVVYCQSGARSAQAVALLRAAGVNAVNLRGGMDAWAQRRTRVAS